jgi:hypothetical protein
MLKRVIKAIIVWAMRDTSQPATHNPVDMDRLASGRPTQA